MCFLVNGNSIIFTDEREKEKQWLLVSITHPNWGSNQQPFGVRDDAAIHGCQQWIYVNDLYCPVCQGDNPFLLNATLYNKAPTSSGPGATALQQIMLMNAIAWIGRSRLFEDKPRHVKKLFEQKSIGIDFGQNNSNYSWQY